MATNKDKNLIGHDPLAWLGLDAEEADNTADDSQSPEPEMAGNDDVDESAKHILENQQLTEEDQPLIEDDSININVELETVVDDTMDDGGEELAVGPLGGAEAVDYDWADAEVRATPGAVAEIEEIKVETEALASNEEDIAVDASEENNAWVDTMTEQEVSPMVDLDATLTIQHVGALHEKLKLCLAMHDQIEINASEVSAIDTATLQLLVALKKDAANLQKQVSIIYPSPRFVESAQLLGLLSILEVAA